MPGDGAVYAAVCCGVVVVAAEPVTILLLRRWAAIDTPGVRSSHTVPTPRGGGFPIVIGLLAATALTRGAPAVPFAAGITFFGALGFADDLRGLTVARRLALQCAGSAGVAALLVAPLGVPLVLRVMAAVAATVWVMGFVNVFNFMDGVNGISASHALIAGVAYACFGEWHQDPFLVAAGLAVAAGCLAFLPWNAFRARVFLGDVGSYALGAALSILALTAVFRGIPPEAAAGPLALYLADTAWTLQRRIRAGERWIEPHRAHTYQRWCDVGWSHQEVTLMTGAATVLLGMLGAVSLTGDTVARAEADLAGLVILAVYLRSPAFFGHPSRAGHGPGTPTRPRKLGRSRSRACSTSRNCRGGRADVRTLIVTHYFPPEIGAPQARLSALAAIWAADGDRGDRTHRDAQPPHGRGPAGVPGRHPAPRTARRLRHPAYLAVRDAERGDSPQDPGPSELHAQQRVARRAGQRPSRRGRGLLTHLLLHRVSLATGPAEAGPAGGRDPDLWPAIFTELGVLTNRWVIGVLERLELAAYAAADEIVVVSEGFRANLISRGVPPSKIHTIRNGTYPGRFDPATGPDPAVRATLGAAAGECLVLYLGTHGISQGLPGIADTAARLAAHPVHFAFVGEGADKAPLERKVTRLGLRNVTLRPGVPHKDVPALLAAADICLVPLRDVPLFASFIPSKMFEYLAAGKAVIGSVAGEAGQILREAGAVVIPPEDSVALADAIRELALSPSRRQAMGRAGRAHVGQFYDRVVLAREYRKILAGPGDCL